jgi:hypothetical protein
MDVSSGANEEAHTELLLQGADVLADAGLAHVQAPRRFGEIERLRGYHEHV